MLNVIEGSPELETAYRTGCAALETARKTKVAADAGHDRIDTFMKVFDLVRGGCSIRTEGKRSASRGFFVRSYARKIGVTQKTYVYRELHIVSISADPAKARALPDTYKGALGDCLKSHCRSATCQETAAPVVGIVSHNDAGYHGGPSTVTFFTLCLACRTASLIDGGYPDDDQE